MFHNNSQNNISKHKLSHFFRNFTGAVCLFVSLLCLFRWIETNFYDSLSIFCQVSAHTTWLLWQLEVQGGKKTESDDFERKNKKVVCSSILRENKKVVPSVSSYFALVFSSSDLALFLVFDWLKKTTLPSDFRLLNGCWVQEGPVAGSVWRGASHVSRPRLWQMDHHRY